MAISRFNFNVPLLDEKRQPVLAPKTDKTKVKIHPNGAATEKPEVDEEGYSIMHEVSLRDVLVRILSAQHQGDDALTYDQRVARGKLLRKVANHDGEVNYTVAQLAMIQDLCLKMGSTALLVQVDEIINGVSEDEAGTKEAA